MFSIISLLLLIGTVYLYVTCRMNKTLQGKFPTKVAIALIAMFAFGMVRPFEVVRAGHMGVMLTLGKVTDINNPGLVWKMPVFQKIVHVTTQPIQVDQKIEVGPGGAITRDNQTVGASMTFFYKYQSDKMRSVYQDYGLDRLANIIRTSGIECFKSEIGNHTIFDIPMNQPVIHSTVFSNIKSKMAIYPIEITELKITNYDWSDEFDKQIQETMHKTQQVKQKAQDLLITEQEAQKLVKQAEAEKQALITKAEGEKGAIQLRAEAKALEGEGIRKYNQSVQANMNLEIKLRELEIQKIKAEKWNGQYVPTNNYGPIPIQTGAIQQ
jgi:regulator of protease activity HflC (stomatin/prohibitin superfamily)